MLFLACLVLPLLACEHLDDDVRTHVPGKEPLPSFLSLEEVARVLSSVDIGASQMGEVHDAVTSSTGNGYDEEYTMQDLFERPGAGVGDVPSKAGGKTYETPLRQLLSEAVKARYGTKASDEGVDADPAWTVEAFGNLLKNCMEHTPPGGTVFIDVSDNAVASQIVIRDTGPGIAPEDLHHIFERFYRGKDAGPNSVGIGLSFSEKVIHGLGGTVKAGNHPEGGAVFTVRLIKMNV